MKQTAVEWLWDTLLKGEFINNPEELLEQAKAMEKERIENAHIDGGKNQRTAVKYYNEIFKKK